jgi:antitoxin component YwqK of YwqJK toxin-antitoxin module
LQAQGHVQQAALAWDIDSTYVMYHGNGKPQSIRMFKDGISHGPLWEFHSSGQIINYSEWYDGQKHGQERSYDQAGRLLDRKPWRYGRLHGEAIAYYVTGVIQSRVNWSSNQKTMGRWHPFTLTKKATSTGRSSITKSMA